MRESSTVCPVPREQQPINEYEQLKSAWLFRWATLEPVIYWQKLGWIWVWGGLLVSPIAHASFPLKKAPVFFGLACILGATLIVSLVVIRLVLGWYYVSDRLSAEAIPYEESGWYDGQTWQKPPEVLARDRLIVSYQIQPIFKRLKQTALILGTIIASTGLTWALL